jgi:hypothetical protein
MNDLLNKLKTTVPWATFGEVISQHLDQRVDATREIVDQLKQWGAHLTSHALSKWSIALVDPHDCQVPHIGPEGHITKCQATALLCCDICSRWSCLAHCRTDWMADGICAVCIGDAKARHRSAQSEWEEQKAKRKQRNIGAAFRTLKLKPSATLTEVKRQYKTLVRQYNADMPQSDKQRARNTTRLQKINEAFEVLKEHFESTEAA